MNRIQNDSNLALRFGENARKVAENEFSIGKFNKSLIEFIKTIRN